MSRLNRREFMGLSVAAGLAAGTPARLWANEFSVLRRYGDGNTILFLDEKLGDAELFLGAAYESGIQAVFPASEVVQRTRGHALETRPTIIGMTQHSEYFIARQVLRHLDYGVVEEQAQSLSAPIPWRKLDSFEKSPVRWISWVIQG